MTPFPVFSLGRLLLLLCLPWMLPCTAPALEQMSVSLLANQSKLPMTNVVCLMHDREGYVWYGTPGGGLCRDDGYRIDVFAGTLVGGTQEKRVYCLGESARGDIWFGTARGCFLLEKTTYTTRRIEAPGMGDVRVKCLHVMRDGTIWVSAMNGMLCVFHESGRLLWQRRMPAVVNSVHETADGQVWCTFEKSILARYDRRHRTFTYRSFPFAHATGMTSDPQNRCLWLSTWGDGMVKMTADGRFTAQAKAATADGNRVFNSVLDTRNHRLWTVTMDDICCYDTRDGSLRRQAADLGLREHKKILDAAVMDRDGNLWVPGHSPHTFVVMSDREGIRRDAMESVRRAQGFEPMIDLYERRGSQAWVWQSRTGWGVYDLSTGRFEFRDRTAAAHRNPHTATDARGHVWTMTNSQVTETNPRNGRSRIYLNTDPLIRLDCFLSLQRDGDSIVVGGIGGLCRLGSTPQLDEDRGTARPRVSSYRVNDDYRIIGRGERRIQVGPDCHALQLNLTTADVLHASHVRFAYRIEGLTDRFTPLPAGESQLTLLALPKGHYRLVVRATDAYGRWSADTECLSIVRQPAWWESDLARVLYLLTVLLMAYAVVRYRHTVQRRRRQFDNMLQLLRQYEAERQQEALKDENIQLSDDDRRWLDKAMGCVEAHLTDPDYGVDTLAADLCMGRMTLYRTMHRIAGQTPSDFIRTLRLERAAHLLTTTSLPVSEVVYRTGFNSASYFSKCFKQKYGVLPKNYRG